MDSSPLSHCLGPSLREWMWMLWKFLMLFLLSNGRSEEEQWRGIVSCTETNQTRPSYCRCYTSFWRLLARHAQQSQSGLTSLHCATMCAPHKCLHRAGRLFGKTWPRAPCKSAGQCVRQNVVNEHVKLAVSGRRRMCMQCWNCTEKTQSSLTSDLQPTDDGWSGILYMPWPPTIWIGQSWI